MKYYIVSVIICLLACIKGLAQFREPLLDGNLPDTDGSVMATAFQGNTCYVGGSFSNIGPKTGGGVVLSKGQKSRVLENLKVKGSVKFIVADGKGGWFIGGDFSKVGKVVKRKLAHILPNYSLDTSWSVPVAENSYITSMLVYGSKLYLSGNLKIEDGRGSIKYEIFLSVSVTDSKIRSGFIGEEFMQMAAYDGNIYGLYQDFPGTDGKYTKNVIHKYDTAAGVRIPWEVNISTVGRKGVNSMLLKDSVLYLGGDFSQVNGVSKENIAAVNIKTGVLMPWNPSVTAKVSTMCIDHARGKLMTFASLNQAFLGSYQLVSHDLSSGSSLVLPIATDKAAQSCLVVGDSLFFGGDFYNVIVRSAVVPQFVERNYCAAVNLNTYTLTDWNPNADDVVFTLYALNGGVFVGGKFGSITRVKRQGLAAFNINSKEIIDWGVDVKIDDERWVAYVAAMVIHDNKLYLGGLFDRIGSVARHNAAAIDLITGSIENWKPEPYGTVRDNLGYVNDLQINDNRIYIAGNFNRLCGQKRYGIGAVNFSGQLLDWNPTDIGFSVPFDLGVRGEFYTMAFTQDAVILGGDLSTRRSMSVNAKMQSLVFVDKIKGAFTDFAPEIAPLDADRNAVVHSLKIVGDKLYVGGDFYTVNGQSRSHLAVFDLVGKRLENGYTGIPAEFNKLVSDLFIRNDNIYLARLGGDPRFEALSTANISASRFTDPGVSSNGFIRKLFGSNSLLYFGGSFKLNNDADTRFDVTHERTGFGAFLICPTIPPAVISSPARVSVCEGESVVLSAASNVYGHLWSTGQTTNDITVTTAGRYFLYNVSEGCTGVPSSVTEVVLHPRPQKLLISVNNDTLTVPSISGYTYQWFNNDRPISGANSNRVTTTGSKYAYKVKYTNNFGCSDSASTYALLLGSGLSTVIYPNPTSGIITVQRSSTDGQVYEVYSPVGSLLQSGILSGRFSDIDLQSYLPGVYWIVVDKKERLKVVKQ